MYIYENITQDPTLFKSETGLNIESFEELFILLNPGENCVNIKFYEAKLRTSENVEKLESTSGSDKKQGPRVKLDPKGSTFYVHVLLKGGFSLKHTAWLFNIPKSPYQDTL